MINFEKEKAKHEFNQKIKKPKHLKKKKRELKLASCKSVETRRFSLKFLSLKSNGQIWKREKQGPFSIMPRENIDVIHYFTSWHIKKKKKGFDIDDDNYLMFWPFLQSLLSGCARTTITCAFWGFCRDSFVHCEADPIADL